MPDKPDSQELEESSDETQAQTEDKQAQNELDESNEQVLLARAPRSQIRAAINSVYNTRFPTAPLVQPAVSTLETGKAEPPEKEPEETAKPDPEKEKKEREIQLLMERAEILGRNGDKERARQLYSQTVRLAPENSDAWSGLGHLLVEQNPERARYCFKRALALDPENTLAILMLKTLDEGEQLKPASSSKALAKLDSSNLAPVTEAGGLQTSSADGEAVPLEQTKKSVKIGLEEAVARLRETGLEVDPASVPEGGARLRSAIESGVLKPGRIRPRRRLPLPRISISGLALSLFLLTSLALLSGVGLYIVITQPSFQPPPPTPTAVPTTPVPTLTVDEAFAARLRLELEKYNRYLAQVKTLVDQQRANKLQWEDFRKGFDDLQKQLKDEKKTVDGLATGVAVRLIDPYRALQDLALTMINGGDYMVSGIHNYEPDDLDEALRQFSRASGQLADIANELNKVVPLPTPTPSLADAAGFQSVTVSTSATDGTTDSVLTPTPTLTPALTSAAADSSTPATTASPATTRTVADSTTAPPILTTPPVTPTPEP
jgi:tetratricopeptide (TPR) repeat protein